MDERSGNMVWSPIMTSFRISEFSENFQKMEANGRRKSSNEFFWRWVLLNLPFFLHLVSSLIIHKCISNKNYGAWRHNMGYIGKTQNKSGRLKFFRSTYRITSLDYYSFFRFKKYLLWNKLDEKDGLLFCFFPFSFWPPKLNSIFEPRYFPIHRSDP